MPLSRLENFLKNAEGNILYVNPSDFDATDSFENQGNSLTRPFKSIQRALIEAARFSYQTGENNDRIDRTTILVYPGTHYIDNRPGYSIEEINGLAVYKRRTAPDTWQETTLNEFNEFTNFDILNPGNDLYKYNSISGGAILPRGTSIIGLDLRKTKIRPLYVPDPEDDNIEATSILNVTGTCYFTAFTIFDADPTKTVYKNYTEDQFVPNYSHHKVTAFTYADGVNKVTLADYQTYLTDLDMYYYKVAKAFGDITGRGLGDFPATTDFEPSVDEFRIVGSLDANPLGISSIRAGNGNGTGNLNEITVTTSNKLTGDTTPHNLFVDSPFLISGVKIDAESYNGSYTVSDVVGINTFRFITNNTPTDFLPNTSQFDTATVTVGSDTVSSASPYIFNCSLRSVYGLNGLHADGSKATGFKSMVTAQFTGVSLQKDNNAFILYDNGTFYEENTLPENSLSKPLHTNSRAIFKPKYENFHIKCSNNSFIQCVSIFAIGFAKHFVTETGGDMSITNSNSNFGNTSLESVEFKPESFDRDDVGYITHIIPPKDVVSDENEITWLSLDTEKIINSISPSKLYIFESNSIDEIPPYQVDGFRIGAKDDDMLYLTVTVGTAQTTYSAPILMPVPFGNKVSARKEYKVSRTGGQNAITNDTITLEETHQLINGERIRVFSDTGQTPDGVENEGIYYAITTGVNVNQIKLAQSLNDALSNTPILGVNNNGGVITIVSRVSDKVPGQIGHPIQWDDVENSWYITSSDSPSENKIYQSLVDSGLNAVGEETSAAFIKRTLDNRSIDDKIYKIRYVIPKEFDNAKPPEAGYVIQESKTVGVSSISYTNDVLTSTRDLRNEKVVVDAVAGPVIEGNQVVTLTTELPHGFIAGDRVKIQKIRSDNNPLSVGIVSTYNGIYEVESVINSRQFQYTIGGVKINPGSFTSDIDSRNTRQQREALPVVSRDAYKETYFIYRVSQIKKHIPGFDGQDGIYHLICLNSSVSPSSNVGYQLDKKEFNQDVRNLYPQLDRDNLNTNPKSSNSYADLNVIGKVVTNDKRNSITRESLDYFLKGTGVGYALTSIELSGIGNTTITVSTDVEHNLNSIKSFTFTTGGGYPPSSTLFSRELSSISSSGEGATVKVTTDPSGGVSAVELLDPGSSYTVSDTLSIPGGSSNSVLTVTEVNDNTNNAIELNGFYVDDLNDAFEVISIPSSRQIILGAPLGISTYEPNTSGELGYAIVSNEVNQISSFELSDVESGIATITTVNSHGLFNGNKVKIVKTNESDLEGDFLIKETLGISTFTVKINNPSSVFSGSTGSIIKKTLTSNDKNLGRGEENIASRSSLIYGKKTQYTDLDFTSTSSTISFSDPDSVKRGEYYVINSEIIRISGASNPFTILRGQFGTIKTTAPSGSVVRKITVIPSELRRPSFMRASGHTFEYLGFGPGNYSTGMPQKQDRILSEDEILRSQSKEQKGGSVVYTGMNDLGEFFSGSKKLSSATGEESVIDAPILTYTGDDAEGADTNLSSGIFDELLVRQRLTVEGGDNNNQTSQFYGPVNFTNKVSNISDLGIETKNFFLKGTAPQSKLLTVGISTPTSATLSSPKSGDIQLISNPTDDYIGHTYLDNEWRQFGFISKVPNEKVLVFDKVGIGTNKAPNIDLFVEGETRVNNIRVTGTLIVEQPQSLGDVSFEDIIVNRSARFTNSWVDPLTGLGTNRTILCESGTQEFNDVIVTGITTFESSVYANSNIFGVGARFGNIRIGVVNDNVIDKTTGSGALVLDSDVATGLVRVEDNLTVLGNVNSDVFFDIKTNDFAGLTSSISAKIDIKNINITNPEVKFDLGVGNTNGTARLALYTEYDSYPNGSFIIDKKLSTSTELIHRGASQFIINGNDSGSSILLKTSGTDRILVGSSGTVTVYQNNSGTELSGAHFKLNQDGSGDNVFSWDITNSNSNIRWYAGIDVSDNYAWKLANPQTTVAYGTEDFDRASETKLKIARNGDTSILGKLDVGGNTLSTPTTGAFTLLNSNITSLNAFNSATTIIMGADTNTSSISLRGKKESTSTSSGALVVAGGVGIAKNLYVGGKIGPSVFNSTVKVEGTADFDDNVNFDGSITFKKTTNNTLGNANTGAIQIDGGVGINKNVTIGAGLKVQSNSEFVGNLTAAKFIKKNGGTTSTQSNFLRADGSDTIIQYQDFNNSLGYVPQPPITLNGYPKGNSIVLQDICNSFNGSSKVFNLYAPDGTAFIPEGAANLIVSINGEIVKPGTDYIIPFSGSAPNYVYQPQIRFIVAPPAGVKCFIVALGGQGMVLDDEGWTTKGQIAVGKQANRAEMLSVGSDDQVLVADASETLGVKWMYMPQEPPIGSVHYFASSTAPDGYLVCDGSTVPNGTGIVQGKNANYKKLYQILGNTFGSNGKLPDLRERMVFGAGGNSPVSGVSGYNVGKVGGTNTHKLNINDIPSHSHPITQNGTHKHPINASQNGSHKHNLGSSGAHNHPGSSGNAGAHGHPIAMDDAGNHSHTNQSAGSHQHPLTLGQVAAHTHTTNLGNAGTHSHPLNIGTNGSHSHNSPATIGNAGDHSHTIDIGQGGKHGHPISDPGHTHNQQEGRRGVGTEGGGSGVHDFNATTSTEKNTTGININQGGYHGHNAGSRGGGTHNHPVTVSIGNNGGHGHPKTIGQNGSHKHPVTVSPNGGHGHPINMGNAGGHTHIINSNGSHKHSLTLGPVSNHTHPITIGDESTQHVHNVSNEALHNHTLTMGNQGLHNHNIGNTGGTSNNQTAIDLRNPYIGLLPVIKAYYVGPSTSKNW